MRAKTLDLEYLGDGFTGTLLLVGWGTKVYRPDAIPADVVAELTDSSWGKICHTQADYNFLWKMHKAGRLPWKVAGPLIDTRGMAWMVDENRDSFSLDSLVKDYLGVDPDKRIKQIANIPYFFMDDGQKIALQDFADDLNDIPHIPDYAFDMFEAWLQFIAYCQRDIVYTGRLAERLYQMIGRISAENYNALTHWQQKEVPYSEVLVDMECGGLPIDLEAAAELQNELLEDAGKKHDALMGKLGYEVNLASPQQLAEVLYKTLWSQKAEIDIPEDIQELLRKANWVQREWEARNGRAQRDGGKVTKKSVADDTEAYERYREAVLSALMPSGFEAQKVGRTKIAGVYTRKGLGLKAPRKRKGSTQDPTSAKVLKRYHYGSPWVVDLLAYRKVIKASQYVGAYPDHTFEGLMYGRFNRTGTVTGRISSSEPNMMNVPSRGELGKKIRGLFRSTDLIQLIVGDHSQLEKRVQAHITGDPLLLDIYRNDRDIYNEVGSRLFGKKVEKGMDERDQAKVIVLATDYGMQADSLAGELTIAGFPTAKDKAQEILDELESIFAVKAQWAEDIAAFAQQHGYVQTIAGRIRTINQAGNYGWRMDGFSREDRQAVNSVIQGSAGDIMQENMLTLHRDFRVVLRMLAQIHDELVMGINRRHDFDDSLLTAIQTACEKVPWKMQVPLKFEPAFVDSWADKQ